jgi:hypothetical protein
MILTWNPQRWDFRPGEYDRFVEQTRRTPPVPVRGHWSVGRRRRGVVVGERVFLLRQGSDRRGIVAAGATASEPYPDQHWDGSGDQTWYVDVVWDRFVEVDERLLTGLLLEQVPGVRWNYLFSSGSPLDATAEAAIEQLWAGSGTDTDVGPDTGAIVGTGTPAKVRDRSEGELTTGTPDSAEPSPHQGAPSGAAKAFLCHSAGDKQLVRDLYRRLAADSVPCWLDEEDLLPGQNWDREIRRAIKASRFVLVCLSRASVTATGYVQKELKFALDRADEQLEGSVFLIPVRLDQCEIPDRLRDLHAVNLFEERGYERLLRALRAPGPTGFHDQTASPGQRFG